MKMDADKNLNINIDNVNIGDKFSTENKLLSIMGYPKLSGNSRLALLKDAQRYVDYSKTGKLYRGKETGEIIVTEKYIEPKSIQDGWTSIVVQYIKPLILAMDNKSISSTNIFLEEFNVVDKVKWNSVKNNNVVEFYKYYLLNDFKGKLKTALKQIYKENELFSFAYEYMLITLDEEGNWIYNIADKKQTEYIESMKLNIKDRIIARHKLKYPMEKEKTWKQLSYRYTPTLYNMINDECMEAFGVNRCVEVITIENGQENEHLRNSIEDLKLYYKIKMNDWIHKNNYDSDSNVVKFHNELWSDVK